MPRKKEPNEKQQAQAKTQSASNGEQADARSFVVGIGASAGGLEAYEAFFTHMPSDSGLSFVLIPHLDPTHKSVMAELLQRFTDMPVTEAQEGIRIEPDHVYVIPPDKDMSLLNGRLVLLDPSAPRGFRHPIDFFFRALATDQGEGSIAIVLSGTGSEGALGLRAIKEVNGLVIAQDPESSKYEGMPTSAIATGLVDIALSPDQMPEKILAYVNKKRKGVRPGPKSKPEPIDVLQKVFVLIRAQTGHDFSHYKEKTAIRRIERRMALHNIEKLEDYVAYLREHPEEIDALFKELLIRVTSFFRDPEAFEALKREVIPAILDPERMDRDHPCRVWVAGCSTGEEAYSIAMLMREHLGEVYSSNIQIFATDIDTSAIDFARAGLYSETITADISPERLKHFFTKQGSNYKVRETLRDMIVFAVHDLIKDPPFLRLDLVSCRNLLIYFDSHLQKDVIPVFHNALKPQGYLFLGTAETPGPAGALFTPVDKKWRIYRNRSRQETPHGLIEGEKRRKPLKQTVQRPIPARSRFEPNIKNLTEKLLLTEYTPPAVLVDHEGTILYFHGRTGKYLEPSGGRPSLNIIDMAREGLRVDLRATLRQTIAKEDGVKAPGIKVKTNGATEMIEIETKYLEEPDEFHGLILVTFRPMTEIAPRKAVAPTKQLDLANARVDELEFELTSTKERLQTTVEELETSNEELKSTNEELQSSNEELQSTNEELETSKEELQSVNEELLTVNQELQGKIDELSRVNNDMTNLFSSTQIATIFLDTNFRIKRFTPSMQNVINLIETDIGRPISDIVTKIDYPHLQEDAESVLNTLRPEERTVRDRDGKRYLVRIMPYRTTKNVIDGVVITFTVISETPEGIWFIGPDGKTSVVNKRMSEALGYSIDELSHLSPEDLGDEGDLKAYKRQLKAWSKGAGGELDIKLHDKQGAAVVVHAVSIPLKDKKGSPQGNAVLLTHVGIEALGMGSK